MPKCPVIWQFLLPPINLHVFLIRGCNTLLEILFEASRCEVESHSDDAEESKEDQLHSDAYFGNHFALVGLMFCVWCGEVDAGDLDGAPGLEKECDCDWVAG